MIVLIMVFTAVKMKCEDDKNGNNNGLSMTIKIVMKMMNFLSMRVDLVSYLI